MPVNVSYSKDKQINATISLPSSKSICNRVLLIKAIGNLDMVIRNLSDSDDSIVLKKALSEKGNEVFAGEGGTTLRFLIAYLCLSGKLVRVTAADSLMQRPLSELLLALKSLGASFKFEQEENKLPLTILPAEMHGGTINVNSTISSQFISALMMIAPYLNGGLKIKVDGDPVSWPYVLMTGKVMNYFGVSPVIDKSTISIPQGIYQSKDISIEADWSAASFWYEIAALSDTCQIELSDLCKNSWQGDSVISEILKPFGVTTEFNKSIAVLKKNTGIKVPEYFNHDMSGCPDLGLPLAALCGGLNVTADLEKLVNFRLKESDRAVAMQRGLYDLNVKTDFCGGSKFKVFEGEGIKPVSRIIKSYNDHRVAMAFAPLALLIGKIIIDDPDVVRKSYPGFFKDLQSAGYSVEYS